MTEKTNSHHNSHQTKNASRSRAAFFL
jgi:hypothetical protein